MASSPGRDFVGAASLEADVFFCTFLKVNFSRNAIRGVVTTSERPEGVFGLSLGVLHPFGVLDFDVAECALLSFVAVVVTCIDFFGFTSSFIFFGRSSWT